MHHVRHCRKVLLGTVLEVKAELCSFIKPRQGVGVATLVSASIFIFSGKVFHLQVLCSGWVQSYILFGLNDGVT